MKPLSQSHPSSQRRPVPYVLAPPVPGQHRPKEEGHEDDYEATEGESDDSLGARIRHTGVRTSGKRTGERDDRADVKKLLDYLDDIFEAEDSLPAASPQASPMLLSTSPTLAGGTGGFFTTSLDPGSEPMLLPHVLRKLLRYIEASSVETRSRRRKGARGALSQVDSAPLGRILRILDRNVKAAIDLEPFPASLAPKSTKNTPKKARKSGVVDRRSMSRAASDAISLGLDGEPEEDMDTPVDDESLEEEPQEGKEEQLADMSVEKCTHLLEIVSLGVMAADCCLALLTADALPKKLYSEDIIKDCLDVVKGSLEKTVYPIVEASADNSTNSSLIKRITESKESASSQHLSATFQSLLSLMPRIDALISHGEHAMSETIVISATYIAIGPFFVVDNSSMGDDARKAKSKAKDAAVFALGGKAGFPALRLSALSLIRSIFANHPDQRSSIIEDILTSLIKLPDFKRKGGQFRLRNGKSINIVSALLLQLVQTTGRGLRLSIKSLKARTATDAVTQQVKVDDGEVLDKETSAEIPLYKSGLDSGQTCAWTILQFLVNRSGKSKTTKDSNEAEYRAVFDSFTADLLTVLYWPEWPAASVLLRLACKLMWTSLEDVKTTADNATKQLALDHLGTIAAHLRSVSLKALPADSGGKPKFRPLEEIVASCSVNRFKHVLEAQSEITAYLAKRASDDRTEDQAYFIAREFSIALWGHEVAINLSQAVENLDADASTSAERFEKGSELVKEMSNAIRNAWDKDSGDVFEASSDHESSRIDTVGQLLGATNPLQNTFDPTIHAILLALTSPAVFMRTKALRAIGQIITCDPQLLRQQNVRQTIESHLVDNSSAVREAAIELIGKYIVQEPALTGEYYAKLSERMADTGLGVRKRVMRLLKSLYDVSDDRARKTDICVKMIQRMLDEDETVKDLAIKSMEEMWFPSVVANPRSSSQPPGEDMRVFMEVVGAFKDRTSMLEDLLRQILLDKNRKDDSIIIQRYSALCDSLINCLVDDPDAEINPVYCVQGIYLLATAHPKVMSGSRAEILLPYLKVATTADERAITDSVLKVFRAAIPGMPKTAVAFGEELQKVLLPMISRPSSAGGISSLQETIACFCAAVKYLTHDYVRLVTLLKPCNIKLQVEIKALEAGKSNPASVQATPLLMFIVAFLNEHCDFDEVRLQKPDTAAQLDSMSTHSITEHFYSLFLKLYKLPGNEKLSVAALQCLGIMFKSYPKLLTHDSTLSLMDSIFASQDVEGRGRVLKILQDFLASEATKRAEEERANKKAGKKADVNMDELIGSADTFADSGIASTVIQRYLGHILEGTLSTHLPTQRFSVDILGYTIRQGLAHPLRCLPVLISLETSPDTGLSARAGALHALLQNKHASMLNSRLIDCARKSFEYQARICEGAVRGFRGAQAPVALLHRWYALVREKRGPRQDLLKAIMKAFDVDTTNLTATEDDVAFVRYMAENVSALEFKTLEEVLTVVRSLMSVLSVAGMQVVDTLARLDLGDEIDADTAQGVLIVSWNDVGSSSFHLVSSLIQILATLSDAFPLMRSSVAVGIILVLKGYLKGVYGLSEEKCLKFVIGKKSNLGDRPAMRKHDYPMDYERLPFAMTSLVTMEDLRTQRRQFLQLWAQDGVTADPADDLDMDQPL
ncbi:ARM repeat-containing protein [Dacryopinax primogenitus]|uniref:Sister chromatid cohesion protein n=1 Tax=Dacryopinax primogenitus (strain DJM 731) TaxID=1858805 RepID=M5G4Q1_DACPD|nr:ARM repeat-containing protein [Dacryopinax primogenitus]EJU03190.1 ARM repeat-containing protein [Dacryopinax primogenitus]